MRYTKYLVGTALTVGLGMGQTQVATAQRAEPNRGEQRQERRERMRQMTPEQRQQYFQQRRQQRLQQMTPEQRQAWTQRRQEMQQRMQEEMLKNLTPAQRQALIQRLQGHGGQDVQQPEQTVEDGQRALLNSAGVTDKEIQDAIIAFVAEQNKARGPLLELAKTVGATLADPATPADKVGTSLAEFRKAATQRKEDYSAALKKLDEKISYSTNPRLEAVLTLVGILGEESQLAGGFPAIFPEGVVATATAGANQ